MWQSADPALGRHLNGGGVFEPRNLSVTSYVYQNPLRLIDPDGEEPVKNKVGMAFGFRTQVMDVSRNKAGLLTGVHAQNMILSWGKTEWTWKFWKGPLPKVGYFNTAKIRYVYTKKGGWIDMAHFAFYAGRALKYKLRGVRNPASEALQEGYHQEAMDKFVAPWSAYSYEDLPSDKYGAIFGAHFFSPNKKQNLGRQLEDYLNSLGATSPLVAPNIKMLPYNHAESKDKFYKWQELYRRDAPSAATQWPYKMNRSAKPMFTTQ